MPRDDPQKVQRGFGTIPLQRHPACVNESRQARSLCHWEHLIAIFPKDTADILRNLKRGKFDVHLQHRRLEPVVNRLVMGILTAALFMGSASLLSNQVRPTIFGLSVPGLLGCGIALIMGTQITLAIRRSGTK